MLFWQVLRQAEKIQRQEKQGVGLAFANLCQHHFDPELWSAVKLFINPAKLLSVTFQRSWKYPWYPAQGATQIVPSIYQLTLLSNSISQQTSTLFLGQTKIYTRQFVYILRCYLLFFSLSTWEMREEQLSRLQSFSQVLGCAGYRKLPALLTTTEDTSAGCCLRTDRWEGSAQSK